jgi:hypothetical protein
VPTAPRERRGARCGVLGGALLQRIAKSNAAEAAEDSGFEKLRRRTRGEREAVEEGEAGGECRGLPIVDGLCREVAKTIRAAALLSVPNLLTARLNTEMMNRKPTAQMEPR